MKSSQISLQPGVFITRVHFKVSILNFFVTLNFVFLKMLLKCILLFSLTFFVLIGHHSIESYGEMACWNKCLRSHNCKKYGLVTLDYDCDKKCKKKCYKVLYYIALYCIILYLLFYLLSFIYLILLKLNFITGKNLTTASISWQT